MRIELQSRLRRFSFAAACFVLVALYLQFALRAFLAAHLAATPVLSNLNKAIRLEPSNAEYREILGRSLALSGTNLDDGIANHRMAVHLNPYDARYWLDLASVYQLAGRINEQEQSVEQAVKADPTTPNVAWEAGLLFLVQGDQEKALRYFRIVFANDPEAVDYALQLCWRASGDANQILDQALPRRPDLYLSFLRLLISKKEVVPAENVWNHLI